MSHKRIPRRCSVKQIIRRLTRNNWYEKVDRLWVPIKRCEFFFLADWTAWVISTTANNVLRLAHTPPDLHALNKSLANKPRELLFKEKWRLFSALQDFSLTARLSRHGYARFPRAGRPVLLPSRNKEDAVTQNKTIYNTRGGQKYVDTRRITTECFLNVPR